MKYTYDAAGNVAKRECSKCGGEVFYGILHTCEGEASRQRSLAARAELHPITHHCAHCRRGLDARNTSGVCPQCRASGKG